MVVPRGEIGTGSLHLELKVQSYRVVQSRPQLRRDEPEGWADDPLHGYRPDLLRLGFGVHPQAGLFSGQGDLEGVDTRHVARDRDDGDYSAAEPGDGGVGAIGADGYRGPALARLGVTGWLKVDQSDLTAEHR